MQPLVVFSHGKDASPQGRKISFLAPLAEKAGWRALRIDYTDLDDPDARVRRLLEADLGQYSRLVLTGSSMGGYVSAVASATLRPSGLFLMAPAFYLPRYRIQAPEVHAERIAIAAGWNDAVVPVEGSIRFAREHQAELHIFNSDHILWDVLPEIGDLFSGFLASFPTLT